jgi:hypothetical protein
MIDLSPTHRRGLTREVEHHKNSGNALGENLPLRASA